MFTQHQYDLPGSAVIQWQSPVIPGKMSSFSDQGEHIPPSGIRHIRLMKGKEGIRGNPGRSALADRLLVRLHPGRDRGRDSG
jgi:hypothetical protein